ncbi:phosphatidylserine decarboxylase, partial [Campylobacter jejuni]|nr:phosphatidylserine decarboxylase [Campylobacter jejuni]MCF9962157.1 phosphatidylserine decarboxylase [Campylobacter jejuni]
IVLISQKGILNFNLKAGQGIKFGEKIAD